MWLNSGHINWTVLSKEEDFAQKIEKKLKQLLTAANILRLIWFCYKTVKNIKNIWFSYKIEAYIYKRLCLHIKIKSMENFEFLKQMRNL